MPGSRDDAMSRSHRHGVSERYAGCAVAYTGLWAGARIPPTELMEASTCKILTLTDHIRAANSAASSLSIRCRVR